MRRSTSLLLIAAVSLTALASTLVQQDLLARILLLGSPAAVAVLAVVQRQREAVVARVLLTAIAGIAVGQVLSVLLGARVADVEPLDSLAYFFLSFGVPVTVALCLIALISTPFVEEESEPTDGAVGSDQAGRSTPPTGSSGDGPVSR